MKSRLLGVVCAYLFALYLPISAEAALIDRGGGFIYDSDQDITFVQDAGVFNWIFASAQSSVESLIVHDSIRNTDWDDWRLPVLEPPILSPDANSELSYLFTTYGISASSPGPFINLQSSWYWIDMGRAEEGPLYDFGTGQTSLPVTLHDPAYVLAVRDEDVVPIPPAVYLFSSGLIGLVGVARRKAA